MSRLFVYKPIVLALGVAFSGTAAAEMTLWRNADLECRPSVARYAAMKTEKSTDLPIDATRITADKIAGQTNVRALAEGDVVLERNAETLYADHIDYDQQNDVVKAGDGFQLTRSDGSNVQGEALEYNLKQNSGSAKNTEFEAEYEGRRLQGVSTELQLHDAKRSSMKNVQFNTCHPGDQSWYIQASELRADRNTNIGVVRHAKLMFAGMPILYTPWADFPLSGNRKSGFLVPSVKIGSNGTEVDMPYYFNLAPNYDVTLAPGIVSSRGAVVRAEARYLMPDYSGKVQMRYMPHDRRSKHQHRYEAKWQHVQQITSDISGGIDVHQVSDDDYFRDFYGRNGIAENVQLNRSAWLDHRTKLADAPIHTNVLVKKYQTLSDLRGRKDSPYALLPRISSYWSKHLGNAQVDVSAHFTRFEHATRQNGSRVVLYPSIQWDFHNRWGYVRPKIGVHATRYWLNRSGDSKARNASRILPIVNVDAGMTFERNTVLFGQSYLQLLEPRVFYNYIPRKSQNDLPNFDSSENSFSYAQLFRENLYSGQDRINSSNSLAFGLQTRLLNRATGEELFRAGIGQKLYINTDNVRLDGKISRRERHKSDVMAFADSSLGRNWFADAHIHYSQNDETVRRGDLGVRYNPEPGKVLSVRYKYGRNEEIYTGYFDRLRQVDLGMQWPIRSNLYAVGRLNYSLSPHRMLEQMLGLEYRSKCGCWSMSAVGQRYVSGLNRYKNAFFLTLQLKDLSSLGSNPYEQLRLGIPGYHKTNEVIKHENIFY